MDVILVTRFYFERSSIGTVSRDEKDLLAGDRDWNVVGPSGNCLRVIEDSLETGIKFFVTHSVRILRRVDTVSYLHTPIPTQVVCQYFFVLRYLSMTLLWVFGQLRTVVSLLIIEDRDKYEYQR